VAVEAEEEAEEVSRVQVGLAVVVLAVQEETLQVVQVAQTWVLAEVAPQRMHIIALAAMVVQELLSSVTQIRLTTWLRLVLV
jgi:hypothetical protein